MVVTQGEEGATASPVGRGHRDPAYILGCPDRPPQPRMTQNASDAEGREAGFR